MEDVKKNWNDNIINFLNKYGIKPNNLNKYKTALTHSSYSEHNNYERYEFIGDRIINFVASSFLFKNVKGKSNKLNDKLRPLISNDNLAKIAKNLNFEKIILMGKNQKITSNIFADSFEAIVGAIYDDTNLETSRNFVEKTVIKE